MWHANDNKLLVWTTYKCCHSFTYLLGNWDKKEIKTLMKSVFSQLSSLTASGAGTDLPLTDTVACPTSGNWVDEWFPQMIMLCTSWDDTPTRAPIYAADSQKCIDITYHRQQLSTNKTQYSLLRLT